MASPIIRTMAQQVFNCGKCIICRKRRAAELAVRCVLEASLYANNAFLTLTYDEKKADYHNRFNYRDIQLFKKSLRRYVSYHHHKSIKIFNVHEYGRNGKKHWHLVLFNYDFPDKILYTVKNGNRLFTSKILSRLWPYGFNTIGDITEASAMYTAQYTQKDFKNGNVTNDKKSHSKHSGIGRDFFLKNYEQILRLGFIPFAGRKIPIPRYFQKLAHKHYSHFYEPQNFYPTVNRNRLYTPFKYGQENKSIADLYQIYFSSRQNSIEKLITEWDDFIQQNAFSKSLPEFTKACENYEYDLRNKNQQNQL